MADRRVLGLIDTVLNSYPGGCPTCPPVHIEPLAKGVALLLGWGAYDIAVKRADWEQGEIMGLLLRYPTNAEIYLAKDLDRQWSRWVTCKELGHLLIDRAEDYTGDYASMVEGMIATSLPTQRKDILSERMAENVATALVMPERCRPHVTSYIAANGKDFQVAVDFQVPVSAVERFRSEEYQDWIGPSDGAKAAAPKARG